GSGRVVVVVAVVAVKTCSSMVNGKRYWFRRSNNDYASSSSVAMAFPLPSTTRIFQVASTTGLRIATPPTGFCACASLDCLEDTGFLGLSALDADFLFHPSSAAIFLSFFATISSVVIRCIPDIIRDQLLRNLYSKDFIYFAFGDELEISKTEIILNKVKRRPRPWVNVVISPQILDD
nr:hypothetical protein [Tanacetum cinerariifolium]